MMLAEGEEVDVLDDHHLVVGVGEDRLVEHRHRVGLVAGGEELQGRGDAVRRPEQPLAVRVLADAFEQGADMGGHVDVGRLPRLAVRFGYLDVVLNGGHVVLSSPGAGRLVARLDV